MIRFLLVIPVLVTLGDVSRFLSPIEFSVSSESGTLIRSKSSAYVAPVFRDSSYEQSDSSLSLYPDSMLLNATEIEKKIGQSIQHRYQCGGTLVAELTRAWVPFQVKNNYVIKIIDCMPDELSASSFIRFEVWDQGKLVKRFGEPVRFSHFVDVYVAKVKLLRGSHLTTSSFSLKPVDILRQNAGAVPSSSSLQGYELASSVNIGAPLKWNNLSKVNLVKKGEVVDVFASGGGIYITMKGVSLDNGVQGGVVRVRNLTSDREFQAKVLNQNSVKVNL
jgi:flagella basal body P-ring formation protein FlgA